MQAKFGQLIKGKQPPEQIFDQLSPGDVNEQMHTFMPKLTAKVFRTYNASIVLDDELAKMPAGLDLEQRKLFYTEANTRVAILCNHQRCAAVGAVCSVSPDLASCPAGPKLPTTTKKWRRRMRN